MAAPGKGPSFLQAVLGASCGCVSVTFHRTAAELGFEYESISYAAEISDAGGKLEARGSANSRSEPGLTAVMTAG